MKIKISLLIIVQKQTIAIQAVIFQIFLINIISSGDVRKIKSNISNTHLYAKLIIILVDETENTKGSYSLEKIDSSSIIYKVADDEKYLITSDITPVTS